ncbi:MAG: hypothetical protein QW503_04650 [Sulfolobales archaeon]
MSKRKTPEEDVYILVRGKKVEEEEPQKDDIDRFLEETARREMQEAKLEQIRKIKAKEAAERAKYEQQVYGAQLSPAPGSPTIPVGELKELAELMEKLRGMSEEEREQLLRLAAYARGLGVYPMYAIPPRESGLKDAGEALKSMAEAVASFVKLANPPADQTLTQALVSKIIDKALETRPQPVDDTFKQAVSALLSYAIEALTSPQKSDIERLAELAPKLREVAALYSPPQGGPASEMYKAWVEMKKLDYDMMKFDRELQAKLKEAEMKWGTIGKAFERLDIASLAGEFMKRLGALERQSSMPTITCSGCGTSIPIPHGVSSVVCARCGAKIDVGGQPVQG